MLFHGCAMLMWARTQTTSPSSTVSAQEQSKAWEHHNFCKSASAKQYRSYRQTHRAHWRRESRAWSNETHRVEDAHSAGMAENGTTPCPQSVDSRQSGRPHAECHDPRKADQVRTCSKLPRVNLHRHEFTLIFFLSL